MFTTIGLLFSLFNGRLRKADRSELVSEHRHPTGALREGEGRLSGLIHSAMDGIVAVDTDHRVVLFNPAAEQLFHRKASEMMGQPVDSLIPERFRAAHREQVKRFTMSGVTARHMGALGEIYGLRADGQEVVLEASISKAESRAKPLYIVILRDITARKRTEQALEQSNQRLRELTGALQDAEEAERKRIARELHDDLGQHLLALRMELVRLSERIEQEPRAALSVKLHEMEKLLDATVLSVRRIMSDLRPAVLDDLGLGAAIEWLAEDFTQRSGISCSAEVQEDDMDTDDRHATAVFRIAQEALTNIWRHAGATQARLSLRRDDHSLVLMIDDNGKGMSDKAQHKPRSFGLRGMRERVSLLGGTLAITSTPEVGTRIRIVLPLSGNGGGAEEESIHD